jgi:hypothetical protein
MRRFKKFKDKEVIILKRKLDGSNRYDEPVAANLWLELHRELQKRNRESFNDI